MQYDGHNFLSVPFDRLSNKNKSNNLLGYLPIHQPDGSLFVIEKNTNKEVYELKNGRIVPHPITKWVKSFEGFYTNIFRMPSGELYASTYNGLLYFKNATAEPEVFLKGEQVSYIIQDREGNIWISTLKNGVFVMRNRSIQMLSSGNSQMPINPPAFLATDGNGTLYCAHNNGLISMIDATTGKWTKTIDVGVKKDCELLHFDLYNNRLYATYNSLIELDAKGNIIQGGLTIPHAKGIAVDEQGNYIYADPNNAAIRNKENKPCCGNYLNKTWLKNFKWMTHDGETAKNPKCFLQLANQRPRCLYLDRANQTIWTSFVGGIQYFKNGEANNLLDKFRKPIVAYRFAAATDGSLWAGTTDHGLICIKNNSIIKQLTIADGLLSNFVKSLSVTKKGVWFYAEKGVQFYNFTTSKISSFTREDGLVGNDVNDILATGGKVWICTSKEFSFSLMIWTVRAIQHHKYI
ncbi:MAG: two-component regulator propeller domain-containing protein [Bacteroidota bacterium]|nr:two-component regulator propeller domain-containing protein [Bacteroidota bacterium]